MSVQKCKQLPVIKSSRKARHRRQTMQNHFGQKMGRTVWICCLVVLSPAFAAAGPFSDRITVTGGDIDILPKVTSDAFLKYLNLAQQYEGYLDRHDKALYSIGVFLHSNAAGFDRFNTPKNSDEINDGVYSSEIITKALAYLAEDSCKRSKMSPGEYIRMVIDKKFRVGGICNVTSQPDPDMVKNETILKYRTLTGAYNNLENPTWGQAGTPYHRFISADYGNGVDSPRRAKCGKELKSSRYISTMIFPALSFPDNELTNFFMEMTQIISHDITLQIMDNNLNTGPPACCTWDQKCALPKIMQHKSCLPVCVPKKDPFFTKHNIGCLHFVRSCPAPRTDCLISVREQINSVSGYLDLSIVYGSTPEVATPLRTFQKGLLTESDNGKHHLPPCSTNNESYCYSTGDVRSNQQIYLASLQTLFLREHNRICKALAEMNPSWTDEILYQEARRIVIGVYQRILYWELLPVLFGKNFPKDVFGKLDSNGFSQCYNSSINGATHNDFTIAYRGLHSIVSGKVTTCGEDRKCSSVWLSDNVGNMSILEEKAQGLDDTFRGMAMSSCERNDPFVTSQISNLMFKNAKGYGTDLMMFDIERGRDHGCASYNKYREYCGLGKARNFEQLLDVMPIEAINLLEVLYNDVDDIDLVVGELLERPAPGSVLGPTLQCILQQQLFRTACGDRFNYLNKNQTYPFTPKQLKAINNMTMSGLVCLSGDNIKSMPRNAFLIPSVKNPIVSCSSIPVLDLSAWKE